MKKFLSIMLALALVLSLGTVAFAAKGDPTEDVGIITLNKMYKATNPETVSPAEIFTFSEVTTVSVDGAAAGITTENALKPTLGNYVAEAGGAGNPNATTLTASITLPEYTSVGVYKYSFTETANDYAGVAYETRTFYLTVSVINDPNTPDEFIRTAALRLGDPSSEEKIDAFENTYSAGSLAVRKEVTGNLGDKSKEFKVTVTFTAPEGETVMSDITYEEDGEPRTIEAGENGWSGETTKTAEIYLKDDETITFKNIPYGVTYNVEEDSYTTDGYNTKYDVKKTGEIEDPAIETIITNDKDMGVDTGVFMDSLPYVLLLVGACAGLVVFFARRRMTHKG